MVPQLMASSRRKAVGRTRMVRREHRQDVAILLPIPFRALLCWMELPMRYTLSAQGGMMISSSGNSR